MYGTKFWGIGFGKRISDKYNFITSLEKIDSNYYLGTINLLGGTQYTNVDAKYNAKSIIFEVERTVDLNSEFKFFINGGLGFSKFSFNEKDFQFNDTLGNLYNGGLKNSNNDILTRFGFGITRVINENLQLITSIDYTDRGKAEWKEPDGDITDFHIKSTNAVIKLRYFFK
jgi:opacity protein-like surface antigen